jgi:AMP nucleosidase
MKSKAEIISNWLPRYTGLPLEAFGQFVLLTNFHQYLRLFAEQCGAEIVGMDRPMPSATANNITMINFTMGSPNAATIMDLLGAVQPKAVLFLGKCGAVKSNIGLGDLILPIAAIRGEGTSNDYFPPEVPALPAFALQKAVSATIREFRRDYWTGVVYTTNRRVWEHDDEFKAYLQKTRCTAIDMESATIFSVGFANHISTGALLLVSDNPMVPEGIKTVESDLHVNERFASDHVKIGIESLHHILEDRQAVKHLRF